MDQREVVGQLQRNGRRHSTLPVAAGSLAGQQASGRPDPLACPASHLAKLRVPPAQVVRHHAVEPSQLETGRLVHQGTHLLFDGRRVGLDDVLTRGAERVM
ncbi:MAG: hypothetical protein ACE5LU_02760 [Anaerolineae bacterium]